MLSPLSSAGLEFVVGVEKRGPPPPPGKAERASVS